MKCCVKNHKAEQTHNEWWNLLVSGLNFKEFSSSAQRGGEFSVVLVVVVAVLCVRVNSSAKLLPLLPLLLSRNGEEKPEDLT